MIKFTINPKGHLDITLDATEEKLKELYNTYITEGHYNDTALASAFEEIDGVGSPFNNGYSFIDSRYNRIGLTEAPFITTDTPTDLGEFDFDENSELWMYSEYQVSDALYQLLEHGTVTFQRVIFP